MPRARKVNTRKIRERILILCEGAKTEPNYFNGIRADKSKENQLTGLRIEVYDTKYNTALELVKQAVELKKEAATDRNPYDSVWVVVDKDFYHKHPEAYNLAEKNDIRISFSSISFEYWFLLHFGKFNISFNRSKDLETYLREHNYYKSYKKSYDHYSKLRKKTHKAIANAQWLRKEIKYDEEVRPYHYNPFTNVDILVDYLLSL
ncbi:MAG: RloB family protein [Flammeovirgaceae bacterium]